ncbi:putative myb dna-binding domain-containing protein [Golovinomyces cichoracearum]|uniref:Putative myb dna-binding domain-containing protein n=1 Tax=Golovinomyces cichoracearum TaxID=62708 RepID=A0A420H7E3_9PEZI|nr:putative myb dna-binding domain-containing protein [Golovinomyces cichoracearum]
MSSYRPGHEQGHHPYIDYNPQSNNNSEDRVYVTQVSNTRHGTSQNLNPIDESHLGVHQHQHYHQTQTPQSQSHTVYTENEMENQPPSYSGTPGLIFTPSQLQPPSSGTKRQRPEDIDLEVESLPGQQMHPDGLQNIQPQMEPSSIVYEGQTVQEFHNHPLPNQGHRSKMPRLSDDDSINMPCAPSVVGTEGMPEPAPRPRGPKFRFTPEDDALLLDLKEKKSLTWKQIADFFPGRSSGTLQVRYCTKLKAKTIQWTEGTIQKLRAALHDYEQEKWRIVAQKVGTGFTSAACKEKAEEL